MTDTLLLTLAASLVATLFGLLIAILGWLGNKIYTKLDEMSGTMHKIAGDLHDRINGLDRRVTVVETKCNVNHGGQ
ncbi:MAG: hypothetical protein KGP14_04015 [Betaproteobacteria bacterium]|nr:hypothetical protein [Betaproteobacteria bacterium]